jgi:hypothetical protein
MDVEDAGVTFYLDDSELGKGVADAKGKKYVGKAILSATVRDVDLWEQLMEQINGLLMYKGSDLKTELIGVLQNRASKMEKSMETRDAEQAEQVQRADQRASLAEGDKVRAEQRVRLLEAEVARLKEMEVQLESLL